MKYAEYKIENQKVEVFNSILGMEKVLLDGRVVSHKFSWFGSEHAFKINNTNYMIRLGIDFCSINIISVRLFKENRPLETTNLLKISKQKKILRLVFTSVLGVLIGVFLGVYFSNLLEQLLLNF